MKRVIRLTESQLTKVVKKIILEFSLDDPHFEVFKITDENYDEIIDNIKNINYEETDGGLFETKRLAIEFLEDMVDEDPNGIYVVVDQDKNIVSSPNKMKVGGMKRIKKRRPKISFHQLKKNF